MLKILFNEFLLRCGFMKIDQEEVITKNEREARDLFNLAFQSNRGMGLIYCRAYTYSSLNLYKFSSFEWVEIALPILTDIECKNIACNYPVSFTEIRNIFPTD